MNSQHHKLIIIGSGPAGLTAAIYAARAELNPLVIAGLTPGGQLMLTSEVENFPGFPEGIQGPELMDKMIKQAERFGATFVNENVSRVELKPESKKVVVGEKEFEASAVIVATGADAKWLNLENEQRLRGKGVSACATCDGFFFKGKTIAVVGGGDSAMEEALFLTKFAEKVFLLNRSEQFKASKIMLERAKGNPKIEFKINIQVTDVLGAEKVEGLQLENTVDHNLSNLSVEGLFLAIGHAPATKVFAEAGMETTELGYMVQKNFTESSVPGVFIAGDVHDHRYRQAITAAGEGCKAALDAEKYLAAKE